MTYYKQININIESQGSFNIYFAYNENTTFGDLLEFIAYNYPEKNICPCFKFKYYNTSNSRYYDLSINEKVYNYINNNGYTQYQIILKKCKNNQKYINLFKISKIQIINNLSKYLNKIGQKINYLKFSENDPHIYFDNIELPNYNEFLEENEDEEKYEEKYDEEDDIIEEIKKNNQIEILFEPIFNLLIDKFKSQMQNCYEKINKLNKSNQILIKEISGDIDIEKINQLTNLGIKETILPRLNLIRLEPKTNQFIGNETSIKKDFTEFYEIIIDIKSIKGISKGWEIKKSKRAETNYEQFKKDKVIKIGVIGNSNKGIFPKFLKLKIYHLEQV